jgi:hypothetical protein
MPWNHNIPQVLSGVCPNTDFIMYNSLKCDPVSSVCFLLKLGTGISVQVIMEVRIVTEECQN